VQCTLLESPFPLHSTPNASDDESDIGCNLQADDTFQMDVDTDIMEEEDGAFTSDEENDLVPG
jgi:hypothetical protein